MFQFQPNQKAYYLISILALCKLGYVASATQALYIFKRSDHVSSQIGQRSFLLLIISLVIMIAIILGIVATMGVEGFEKLLLDNNPFAIGMVPALIGALLFLFHKLVALMQS